ncbi:ABC transporter permease [Mariniblastus fucicola]|uniref:Teichoic acid translocation permease protein TagG n=1 Tax=Mariniblastus fucicola TaxID=980251 RepID=A0A5B9P5H4_9BACT|nr:ABC transporter permease [Mariniblastus fucicola]QEG21514.1 Teichoic acid translocation permease protein TagG [Mariniblastus fucicola]
MTEPTAESYASDETIDPGDEMLPKLEIQTSDQLTVYNSQSEIKSPLEMFQNIANDFWSGRELGWRLFLRNLRGLYRQTFLGLFWAFLPPIANTAIWVFLRHQGVFKLGGNVEIPLTVYILTGMILWQTFIEAFQMPLKVINQNRGMIAKLRFPRESLLLVGLGEVLFDFAIRSLLLIPAFLWYQVVPEPQMLWALPIAFLMILFASGLGMLIMPVGSLYQDISRFIGIATPFWMLTTPIIYPITAKMLQADPNTKLLVWLNPAAPLIVLGRDLTLFGESAFVTPGLIVAAVSIPIFLIGLAVFRISIPVIVERMNAY